MINADHIAVLLEEHARVEGDRLVNIPYLAVKIAEAVDAERREDAQVVFAPGR